MTGWELRLWRKGMCWSREKAAAAFGVTLRTWHAWENAAQVDVTVWRTTQALSVVDLLPAMHRMTKASIIRRLENEFSDGAADPAPRAAGFDARLHGTPAADER